MSEKKDLELFYIVPYTISYDSGGYYYNDETCSTAYYPPSKSVWRENALFFEEKEQLLNWFYKNAGKPIPNVYRIKYIGNHLGIDDVFKITNLKNGIATYYTALSEDYYAVYDEDMSKRYSKTVWTEHYSDRYDSRFKYIFKAFSERGIKIKYDVYEKGIDKKEYFDFIGDPCWESEEAKGKQLILYRISPKGIW